MKDSCVQEHEMPFHFIVVLIALNLHKLILALPLSGG